MNYNINLLKDNEKRSVAVLSIRSVTRISTILVPVIIVFVIGIYFLNYLNLKQELNGKQTEWSELKNREKTADDIAADSDLSTEILRELEDWKSKEVQLHGVLIHLMVETPEDLYLKTLNIQRTLKLTEQQLLSSSYNISIKGIIDGDDAQSRVVNYKTMLETSMGLKDFIETVTVAQYDENLNTEDDLKDKVFTISIKSAEKVSK
jgi:hypothetical protein